MKKNVSSKGKKIALVTGFVVVVGAYLFTSSLPKSVPYVVSRKDGHYEFRNYGPLATVEYVASGTRTEATKTSIALIKSYVHGNNGTKQELIEMEPILLRVFAMKAGSPPERLPVSKQTSWYVKIPIYTDTPADVLPIPNNDKLKLVTLGDRKMLVFHFSGEPTDEIIQKHIDEMKEYGKTNNLALIATPMLAVYHHPAWMPNFLRKNEIMWQLLTIQNQINLNPKK